MRYFKANTYTRIPRTGGFGYSYAREKDPQLRIEESNIPAAKDLGHKYSTDLQHVGGDI